MPNPSLTILYVEDLAASAAFYTDLLGRPPAESSPGFALFRFPSGAPLGLWARSAVMPSPTGKAGGGELTFMVDDVDAVHADWAARGIMIEQPLIDREFGRSFVALDPDGHRLRPMKPSN